LFRGATSIIPQLGWTFVLGAYLRTRKIFEILIGKRKKLAKIDATLGFSLASVERSSRWAALET
jgi:hypothetical protein